MLTWVRNSEPVRIPQEVQVLVRPGFVVRAKDVRQGEDGAQAPHEQNSDEDLEEAHRSEVLWHC